MLYLQVSSGHYSAIEEKKPRRGHSGLVTSCAFICSLYGKSFGTGVLMFCGCMCMQTCSVTRGLRGAVLGAGLYVLFELLLCQFYGI